MKKRKAVEKSLFDTLPEFLKDPDNAKEVVTRLERAMISDHSHTTIKAFQKCKRCMAKYQKRQEIMKEYGFTSPEQYVEWKRIIGMALQVRKIQNEEKEKTSA